MKHFRTFLLMCFLFVSLTSWAQPQEGWIMAGGTAGFNSYSIDNFTRTTFNISPVGGYFITDNIEVGAVINLTFFGGDDEGSVIGIGPFVRYYVNQSGAARFFGQGGFAINSFDPGFNFDTVKSFGFGLGAGLDLFLNDHVALEAILGFDSEKEKDADESGTNIGLNIGVAAFIGG